MIVAAFQEKEKNEKAGKTEAGEERNQSIEFKQGACWPSAVDQRAAQRKNGLCEGSARSNWYPREGQQPFQPNPNGVWACTITLRRLLIGADHFVQRFD